MKVANITVILKSSTESDSDNTAVVESDNE